MENIEDDLYNSMINYYSYHSKNINDDNDNICYFCKIELISYNDKLQCDKCGYTILKEILSINYNINQKPPQYTRIKNLIGIIDKYNICSKDKDIIINIIRLFISHYNKVKGKRKFFLNYSNLIFRILKARSLDNECIKKIKRMKSKKEKEQNIIIDKLCKLTNIYI